MYLLNIKFLNFRYVNISNFRGISTGEFKNLARDVNRSESGGINSAILKPDCMPFSGKITLPPASYRIPVMAYE